MAKKGKPKISKVKRNNQTTNKMKKQGKLRLQRHRTKIQKQHQPTKSVEEYYSESDSASGEEWADMLDEEEKNYILKRLAKQPQLLSNVPEKEDEVKKSGKRKRPIKEKMPKNKTPTAGSDSGAESDGESDSDLEEKYEKQLAERPIKKLKPLLPIKTKEGIMEMTEECDDTESEHEDESKQKNAPKTTVTEEQEFESDSGMEGTGEEGETVDPEQQEGGVVTTVELLAARRDRLRNDKLRIGALCSSLLESPDKKLKNFYPILYLMEERLKDGTLNLHSIRKLATLSACEVFKDILPEYHIRHQDYSNVKLKKDTLSLYKYEKELLEFYKRYLQRLEKAAGVLRPKKGDTRKADEATTTLALVSLRCMAGLLAARPGFNYAPNIAQSVIPHLDSRIHAARHIVTEACTQLFSEDNKGDITLTIVRLINQLVKRRGERLHPSALDCLLTLRIRDVDMDAEADIKHKKKQDEKRKKRIVNLSKKEKKRAKKLKEVERELLETEAQESEAARRKQLTEVTRTVFHIYFRLLKSAPTSRLLAAALNGLAKFTHVINVEYYSDLVSILSHLISEQAVGGRERLLCVRTVLAVLAGAGDALALDPATFHAYFYAHMLDAHAGGREEESRVVVEGAAQIVRRARRVSRAVTCALAKRLCCAGTQLRHHAALAALQLLHTLLQQNSALSSMLENESESSGSGRFDPLSPSPEHCNAHAARLYELCALGRHYHPTVREAAASLLRGGTLPQHLNKLSPMQVFETYDGSQMSFRPAVTPPQRAASTSGKPPHKHHRWAQDSFRELSSIVPGRRTRLKLPERIQKTVFPS